MQGGWGPGATGWRCSAGAGTAASSAAAQSPPGCTCCRRCCWTSTSPFAPPVLDDPDPAPCTRVRGPFVESVRTAPCTLHDALWMTRSKLYPVWPFPPSQTHPVSRAPLLPRHPCCPPCFQRPHLPPSPLSLLQLKAVQPEFAEPLRQSLCGTLLYDWLMRTVWVGGENRMSAMPRGAAGT